MAEARIADLFRSVGTSPEEVEEALNPEDQEEAAADAETAEQQDQEVDDENDEMEEVQETLESIKATLESLRDNGGGCVATNQHLNQQLYRLAEQTGVSMECISLESVDGTYDYTASLEAVSGLLDRLVQGYVVSFKGFFDAWGTLILGRARKANQYIVKIDAFRKEWKEKKPHLRRREVVGSYASRPGGLIDGVIKNSASWLGKSPMALAFMRNNQVQFDPLRVTTEDLKRSKEIMVEYPKALAAYAGKVDSIIRGAKLDSDEAFLNSVVKKLAALDHPTDLFDAKLVGNGPNLLGNWGLKFKVGSQPKIAGPGKDYDHLSALAQRRMVKYDNFGLHRLKPMILHDVVVPVDDVDKLFSNANEYMQLVVEYFRHFDVYTANFKSLSKSMSGMKVAGADLGPEGKAALRQTCTFISNLVKASKTPIKSEVWRIISTGLYLTYFSARLIDNAN